jgi:multiple sugar transport system ATP-binding protein
MTMASRIVIMKDGYVQQIGTPIEVFNHPVNKFVAGFIGSPSMNFFDVTYKDGVVTFASGETLRIPDELLAGKVIPEHVILGLRPENIHNADSVRGSEHPDANFTVTVRLAELLGNEYYIHAPFGGIDMVARFPSDKNIQTGDTVTVNFSQKRVHLFNPETEEALF